MTVVIRWETVARLVRALSDKEKQGLVNYALVPNPIHFLSLWITFYWNTHGLIYYCLWLCFLQWQSFGYLYKDLMAHKA